MRKATFTDTTVTFTEQFTVVDAQCVKYWEDLTEEQLEQFRALAIEWEKGFMFSNELSDRVRSILYPESFAVETDYTCEYTLIEAIKTYRGTVVLGKEIDNTNYIEEAVRLQKWYAEEHNILTIIKHKVK